RLLRISVDGFPPDAVFLFPHRIFRAQETA
ncbi:MAG: hypothetical protein JWN14_2519, partial [Chthonomonadales bacterium]|nr:hypothetical protein [Chthonomonadales bacterium]